MFWSLFLAYAGWGLSFLWFLQMGLGSAASCLKPDSCDLLCIYIYILIWRASSPEIQRHIKQRQRLFIQFTDVPSFECPSFTWKVYLCVLMDKSHPVSLHGIRNRSCLTMHFLFMCSTWPVHLYLFCLIWGLVFYSFLQNFCVSYLVSCAVHACQTFCSGKNAYKYPKIGCASEYVYEIRTEISCTCTNSL